jgi:signal transduction histidine kinase/PAS domain-containing protein
VAGTLLFSYAETVDAHTWVSRTVAFQLRVTSFRVWIQRGTNEVLVSFLGLDTTDEGLVQGDRVRARAELEAIREFVAGDPDQVARVDELSALLERRIHLEDAAVAAFRSIGPEGAATILAGSDWRTDRMRIRAITSALLRKANEDFLAREDHYASMMRRIRVALVAGLLLMLGTFLFLLRQMQASQQAREEAVRAHELARQRLADLEAVLDTVPAAVFIARDPECRDVRGNRSAEVLVGASSGANLSPTPSGEWPDSGLRFLRDGAEVPRTELPLDVAARTGAPVDTCQMELAFPDGSRRHVLATAVPLLDAHGAPRGAVGALVDVSDVVGVAHELRATLEQNRKLLASARRNELLYREMARNFPNGAIALFDRDLRFLVFDGTQFALRRAPETNVGRTLSEIFPPELAGRLEGVHRDAVAGREGRTEVEIAGRIIEIRSSPVRDETGAVIMGIAVSQDVTEERSLRAQLAVSSRLASLGTLVAGVAHEVNNPLAGTLASLATAIEDQRAISSRLRGEGVLDREWLAAASDEIVEILLDAQVGGDRISRIVKDLALFGRPNPMRTRVHLGDVVTASMRWLPSSVGRAATVRVDDLGAPDVHASAGQLEQVVVNLVTNAGLSIPEGCRGEIALRLSRSDEGRAVLEVADNGAGIQAATMERIFDPFFTTRDVGQGMGLGLPICHAIVTAHGGTLTAVSVPGEGSKFRIELPAVPPVE